MEPKKSVESFFKMVLSGKISEAYDQLLIGSMIPINKPQAVDVLKQQTLGGLPMYGNIFGVELIVEEEFGESIVRLVYALKSEFIPIFWEFYFYKPKTEWFLTNILFGEDVKMLNSMK